jgi:flagellar hook-basal body complex protein FliE
MAIDPVNSIVAATGIERGLGAAPSAQSSDFSVWLQQQINAVNSQIQAAETQVTQLATGQSENLHQVMLSLEKAKLSFELMLQVRNKLLEGYQEVMRMQI